MRLKLFLSCLLIAGVIFTTTAQKVKRKGVTFKQPAKKEQVALYSLDQLNGKWQEIKRTAVNAKTPMDFSDTLLMNFYDDGKVELKDATSMRMSMTGKAQIEAPNSLTVAGDIYSIMSLSKEKLTIDDGEFIKELQKKDQFYYETVGKIKIEKDSFAKPVTIDINSLKGRWLVYSRQSPPGTINEKTSLIKSIDISSISEDGIAFGKVVFYNTDISKEAPCQMVTKDGTIKIITDKDTWNFNTYKADGKEFVFGETGKLVYYAKRL